MNKQIISLQYLRGLAAMLVVYHHSITKIRDLNPESLIPYSGFGNAGVDVFFVISGFIMWVTTASRTVSPTQFWYRRIIRVVPLYWFFIFAMVMVKTVSSDTLQSVQLDPDHLIKSLFFIPHYHPVMTNQIWPLLIPGWTLNYEMFFYFLFGASLFLSKPARLPALFMSFLVLVSLGYWVSIEGALFLTYTNSLLLEFLAGIIIGAIYLRNIAVRANVAGVIGVVAFVWFVCFEASILPGGTRVIAWGVPAALLVVAMLMLEREGKVGKNATLLTLGNSSYSIYLSHILTIEVIESIWHIFGWQTQTSNMQLLFLAINMGVSVFVGILTYKLIEQPMLTHLRARLET